MQLTDPIFTDAEQARVWLEAQRWPSGPICPHCGNADAERITKLEGKVHRAGLYQCAECREQFTVQVGTVMERSHIKLNLWLAAMFLMASSKKGMSAAQVSRMLNIPYKTSWFLLHRVREAMKEDAISAGPLGGAGKTVEADETYIGQRETPRKSKQRGDRPFTKRGKSGGAQKRIVVGLVERGGKARMFHLNEANKETVRDVLVRNVSRDTVLYTDESRLYTATGTEYASHGTVNHSAKEYARREGEVVVHTNTIENVFSVFKRGMIGVYQHCGEAHLHRYLAEFDFRYNRRTALGVTDTERTQDLVRGAEGKRLMYRRPATTPHA